MSWLRNMIFGVPDDWKAAVGRKALVLFGAWTPEGYVFTSDHPEEVTVDAVADDNVRLGEKWYREEALKLRAIL